MVIPFYAFLFRGLLDDSRRQNVPRYRRQECAARPRKVRISVRADLRPAAITVTLRRADEMGDAITARGGTGQISAAPSRPKLVDWISLSIASAVWLPWQRSCRWAASG
jgi:energy-coupling factor transporter transmembrane protein EcfT